VNVRFVQSGRAGLAQTQRSTFRGLDVLLTAKWLTSKPFNTRVAGLRVAARAVVL
jgi:hypothetical protein